MAENLSGDDFCLKLAGEKNLTSWGLFTIASYMNVLHITLNRSLAAAIKILDLVKKNVNRSSFMNLKSMSVAV